MSTPNVTGVLQCEVNSSFSQENMSCSEKMFIARQKIRVRAEREATSGLKEDQCEELTDEPRREVDYAMQVS